MTEVTTFDRRPICLLAWRAARRSAWLALLGARAGGSTAHRLGWCAASLWFVGAAEPEASFYYHFTVARERFAVRRAIAGFFCARDQYGF